MIRVVSCKIGKIIQKRLGMVLTHDETQNLVKVWCTKFRVTYFPDGVYMLGFPTRDLKPGAKTEKSVRAIYKFYHISMCNKDALANYFASECMCR